MIVVINKYLKIFNSQVDTTILIKGHFGPSSSLSYFNEIIKYESAGFTLKKKRVFVEISVYKKICIHIYAHIHTLSRTSEEYRVH